MNPSGMNMRGTIPVQELITQLSNGLSPNAELRKNAEIFIMNCANNNLIGFLTQLSSLISQDNIDLNPRKMAGMVIKNLLSRDYYINIWNQTDDSSKGPIKDNLLATLASQHLDVRKSTATVVAAITKLEFPNGKWKEVIGVLSSACGNNLEYIQLSAVTTISYIFQEIQPGILNENEIEIVLEKYFQILNNPQANKEIIIEVMKGLDGMIKFLAEFFKQPDKRSIFYNSVNNHLGNMDKDVRNATLALDYEFIKYYYDYISSFATTLANLTNNLMGKDQKENVLMIYEIWCGLAEHEIYRIKKKDPSKENFGIAKQAEQMLLPFILQHLYTEDYEDEEWNLSKAAGGLISLLSQCTDEIFVKKIVEYVGTSFDSGNEHVRHSALYAFGNIQECEYRDFIFGICKNSFKLFTENLNQQNTPKHIKNVTAWVIKNITMNYSMEISHDGVLFNNLFSYIIKVIPNLDKRTQVELCHAIHYLSQPCPKNVDSNQISTLFQESMSTLVALACNQNNYDECDNVSLACFYAISTIIDRAARDTKNMMKTTYQQLMLGFQTTLDPNFFSTPQIRFAFNGYLCSTFSAFLLNPIFDVTDFGDLFNYVIKSFHDRNGVYDEGINLIGNIARTVGDNFCNYIDQAMPFILIGISDPSAGQLATSCALCISDICSYSSRSAVRYIDKILDKILNTLKSPSSDPNLKHISINCIGDIFLGYFNNVYSQIQNIMEVIGLAMVASASIVNEEEDPDTALYYSKLREAILMTITLIFSSISAENGRANDFKPYVDPIFEYIYKIIRPEYSPSLELIKSCLGLIADFGSAYGIAIKPKLDKPSIEFMFHTIESNKLFFEESENIVGLLDFARRIITDVMR